MHTHKWFFLVVAMLASHIGYAQKAPRESLRDWSILEVPKTELKEGRRVNTRTNVPVALYGINYGPIAASSENIARQFLGAYHQLFRMKPDLSDLQHDITQETPGGYHVRFHQTFQGVPVYLSDIVVSVSSNTVAMFMGAIVNSCVKYI